MMNRKDFGAKTVHLVKVDVSVLISTEILTISGEVKHFFEIYFSFLLVSLVQAVNECKRLIIKCVLSRGSCSENQMWTSLLLVFLRNRSYRRFGFTHMIGKSEFFLTIVVFYFLGRLWHEC